MKASLKGSTRGGLAGVNEDVDAVLLRVLDVDLMLLVLDGVGVETGTPTTAVPD